MSVWQIWVGGFIVVLYSIMTSIMIGSRFNISLTDNQISDVILKVSREVFSICVIMTLVFMAIDYYKGGCQ